MKKQLRNEIINKRLKLSKEEIELKSKAILEIIKKYDLDPYTNILIFMDFKKEVQTKPIIEYLMSIEKKIVLPKINKNNEMTLHPVSDLSELKRSKFGILEPIQNETIPPHEIDLIFAPGLAFDLKGMRLGYGGGYYDQLLSKIKKSTPVIGLAFDFQVVEQVPYDERDKAIDGLITEKKLYNFNIDFDK